MPIIDELVVGLLRTFNLEVDITSYFSCPTTLLAVPIKNKKMNILTAKRIESELEYPGQIKVHVLRETKVVEYAK